MTRTSGQSSKSGGAGAPADPGHGEPEVVVIAVMGPTGTGKSTFINRISGSKLGIGRGLESCTNVVQPGKPFELDGRRVVLIDTPGFDDTNVSDVDVLNMIATYLVTTYKRGMKLTGVLYFYRISDPRMGGTQRKNFNMFKKLCGENALPNVVIVTNMWGVVDLQDGEAREAELREKSIFFKTVLEKGARMARHMNTVSSAKDILRLILRNRPLPLRIQEEIVDEGKYISDTSAGRALDRELWDQIKKHKKEIRELEEEMERAIREKDEEAKRELEAETKKMEEEVERIKNDSERMAADYKEKERKLEADAAEIEEKVRESLGRAGFRPDLIATLAIAGAAALAAPFLGPLAAATALVSGAVAGILSWFG